LRQIGAGLIDAAYFCADPPAASTRRKPEPGMVLEAAAAYDIDLSRSYFIGDKSADIECGRRAGTRTILVLTGYPAEPDSTPISPRAIWLRPSNRAQNLSRTTVPTAL